VPEPLRREGAVTGEGLITVELDRMATLYDDVTAGSPDTELARTAAPPAPGLPACAG
jgi:hypothetical protein